MEVKKKIKTKVVAMYLPQFHQIPENDLFWGKGFTDWIAVKNARPLFEGHQQPRVPLNNNYYDLSIKENVAWQAKLAKEYGLYGFGIYHYWFNNEKNLLTKPAQIILENKDIDINYFYTWDNISWKRSWDNVKEFGNDWAPLVDKNINSGPAVLIKYILGGEKDWEKHYDYLLPFFKDDRYIKVDNKPMFNIMIYSKDILPMCEYWNSLAKKDGFNGIYFIFLYDRNREIPDNQFVFTYEPAWSGWKNEPFFDKVIRKCKTMLGHYNGLKLVLDYDKMWQRNLKSAKSMSESRFYHGALVDFDDTPRRGIKARYVRNASPKKFEKYLSELIKISSEQGKEFVFLTAWNEWGEGAYLEPDEKNGYEYLEALKSAISQQ